MPHGSLELLFHIGCLTLQTRIVEQPQQHAFSSRRTPKAERVHSRDIRDNDLRVFCTMMKGDIFIPLTQESKDVTRLKVPKGLHKKRWASNKPVLEVKSFILLCIRTRICGHLTGHANVITFIIASRSTGHPLM